MAGLEQFLQYNWYNTGSKLNVISQAIGDKRISKFISSDCDVRGNNERAKMVCLQYDVCYLTIALCFSQCAKMFYFRYCSHSCASTIVSLFQRPFWKHQQLQHHFINYFLCTNQTYIRSAIVFVNLLLLFHCSRDITSF